MNKVNLIFLCNFKPSCTFKKKNFKKKIFCKNFIIFIMFLNFFKSMNSTMFMKPMKKKTFAMLKAPHSFKTSSHLIVFSSYTIISTLNISKKAHALNLNQVMFFFKNFFSILSKIDSSLCYQKFMKISFLFSYKKIFH